jgi:Asp/Glu/hydantoin racemase
MRLLALTPIAVSDDEVARRQRRYDAIAPAGLRVVVRRPEAGLPEELATDADVRASDAALVAAYSAEPAEGWDGFLPDCVLDPAVHAASRLSRPIHGIGRLTMHALAGSGLRWRSVARNDTIAAELDRLAQRYGTSPAGPTEVLSLSVADIADHAVWGRALTSAVATLDCDAVLNGCSAVDVEESGATPVVVDPTVTALRVLAEVRGVRSSAA